MNIDPNSRDWKILEQRVNKKLATHRTSLESVRLDEQQTNYLRGKIAELRWVLEQSKPEPEVPIG